MNHQPFRLVQISDPHLSADRAYYQDNWEITLDWLERERPDMVVVTGDMAINDPDLTADLAYARTQLDRIPVPWRAIPGNHDIGDNVVSGKMNKRVTEARLAAYCAMFGEDRWHVEAGGWSLLGVNSLVLNSEGMPSEAAQAEWIEATLATVPTDRPLALFLHKPLFLDHPGEAIVGPDGCDPVARARLTKLVEHHDLRVVACGHQHQLRSFRLGGVSYLWAPSVAVVNRPPEAMSRGRREVGFLDIALYPDGRVRQRHVGSDFLFRNESYVRVMEYGNTMLAPPEPLPTTGRAEAAE